MAFQLQFHARASHRRGSRRRQRHRRSPGCFLLFRRCASQDPGYRLTRYFVVVTSFSIRANIAQERQPHCFVSFLLFLRCFERVNF